MRPFKRALITDGWTITHDPLFVSVGGVDLYIDLGAEKLITAERGNQQIAVEIKSFLSPSLVSDFHAALGQFLNYRLALEAHAPTRILYLAVPVDAYETFFVMPLAPAPGISAAPCPSGSSTNARPPAPPVSTST